MESFNIFNALAGMASVMGAVAVYQFKLSQSKKARADLLAQLDDSIAQEKKHSTGELFYLLHGLRMNFEDIKAICSDGRSAKIVHALRKTPGIVTHENGRFKYTGIFEKLWVRQINKFVMRLLAYVMAAIALFSIILMGFLDGTEALALLIVVAPLAAFFGMQVKDIRHDDMVESLVGSDEP
ncbi:hypothetical protein [Marinobacter nauticus]|uniref:hypothetical protein n=1 Tax=Marinobacter nauticus TaxID=2743 RepID=UPI001CFD9C56|nr:hypothetical protein [Marinobacter nauticus]